MTLFQGLPEASRGWYNFIMSFLLIPLCNLTTWKPLINHHWRELKDLHSKRVRSWTTPNYSLKLCRSWLTLQSHWLAQPDRWYRYILHGYFIHSFQSVSDRWSYTYVFPKWWTYTSYLYNSPPPDWSEESHNNSPSASLDDHRSSVSIFLYAGSNAIWLIVRYMSLCLTYSSSHISRLWRHETSYRLPPHYKGCWTHLPRQPSDPPTFQFQFPLGVVRAFLLLLLLMEKLSHQLLRSALYLISLANSTGNPQDSANLIEIDSQAVYLVSRDISGKMQVFCHRRRHFRLLSR